MRSSMRAVTTDLLQRGRLATPVELATDSALRGPHVGAVPDVVLCVPPPGSLGARSTSICVADVPEDQTAVSCHGSRNIASK